MEWRIIERAAQEQNLALAAMAREAALGFVMSELARRRESALDRRLRAPGAPA